jgi:hypothetical protein
MNDHPIKLGRPPKFYTHTTRQFTETLTRYRTSNSPETVKALTLLGSEFPTATNPTPHRPASKSFTHRSCSADARP